MANVNRMTSALAGVVTSFILCFLVVTSNAIAGNAVVADRDFTSYERFSDLAEKGKRPEAGEIYRFSTEEMRPTQFVLGMEEVEARARKIAQMSKEKRQAYLKKKVGRVVIGPGGIPWLFDGHHLARSLEEDGYRMFLAQVADDFSNLAMDPFFRKMEDEERLWLYDENGVKRSPSDLPQKISMLKDDPYRSLAWTLEERGFIRETDVPFAEFKWGAFFRERISPKELQENPDKALKIAIELARSPDASRLPGFESERCLMRAVSSLGEK